MVMAALVSCHQPGLALPALKGVHVGVPKDMDTGSAAPSNSTDSSRGVADKVRLRVGFGGSFVQDCKDQVKYIGGSWYLDSFPLTFKYADLVFRLTEKVNDAISIKYLMPGEALEWDNLVDVWDDDDVQELIDDYQEAAQNATVQGRVPRVRVFLTSATEEAACPTIPEDLADDFTGLGAEVVCRSGELSPAMPMNSSLESSYSGGAGSSPGDADRLLKMNQELASALSGIENNPLLASWVSPSSEETGSALSSALQKNLAVSGGLAKQPQGQLSFAAGGMKDNTMALQLPTHLSVFGELGTNLPSHISEFGDTSTTPSARQLEPEGFAGAGLLQQQPAALTPPALPDTLFSAQQISQLQQSNHVVAEAGWEQGRMPSPGPLGNGLQPTSPRNLGGGWDHLHRSPSWTCVQASVPHVPRADVRVTGTIAEGAFGQVSIAKTHQFSEVAIKWIKPGRVEQHLGAFWREAQLLSRLNHPHLLRMYGVVCESDTDLTVVGIMTEYVRGGSLSANLRNLNAPLPLLLRAQLALQIASGMAFLHDSNVVHFDLKPDNVLLDVPLTAQVYPGQRPPCVKVADFGLSKEKQQAYVSGVRDLRGTLPFIAPELVNNPDRITEKADVWSMGMLMWLSLSRGQQLCQHLDLLWDPAHAQLELLTLTSPFQDMAPNMIIAGLMKGNLRPEVPGWCEPSWERIMRSCWHLDPAVRPSFRAMAQELEFMVDFILSQGQVPC